MTTTPEQLPLLGYDVVTTGPGQWTVKAKKPVLGRPTVRVKRAAEIAQCSVQTVYVAILAGEVEADLLTPTAKRVFADSLYEWIENRKDFEHWTPERAARWRDADRVFNSRKPKSSSRGGPRSVVAASDSDVRDRVPPKKKFAKKARKH
jgi:hypothetical protein